MNIRLTRDGIKLFKRKVSFQRSTIEKLLAWGNLHKEVEKIAWE
jgi:hypothetical protein